MNQGTIDGLNDKGFGFIKVEGMPKNIFFHITQLRGVSFQELSVGDKVEFDDIEDTHKGKSALGVKLIQD